MNFNNPVGLSAGFDYNADLVQVLPDLGFGFNTIGTVTFEAYGGNPLPMIARLIKSRSLLINKGFKNEGIQNVLNSVPEGAHKGVRGVSIGVTNKFYNNYEEMINNLIEGFKVADSFKNFDYYEFNISCPNLRNITNIEQKINTPSGIDVALKRISELGISRPIFVKMPLEYSGEDEVFSLVDAISPYSFVKGLIFSNLAKDRTNSAFDKDEIAAAPVGNFSGKPTEEKSNALLGLVYKKYHTRFVLIGTGGVFSAEDAYTKIKNGATLVQMITGMIFEGPQVVGDINAGLATLLKRDGYKKISEAIGVDAV
jgi:dihydroorotate dehydrogenase